MCVCVFVCEREGERERAARVCSSVRHTHVGLFVGGEFRIARCTVEESVSCQVNTRDEAFTHDQDVF